VHTSSRGRPKGRSERRRTLTYSTPVNVAAGVSLAAACVNLTAAVFHLAISRAPGWRFARVFAAIALSAGLYNAIGPIFATDGLAPETYRTAASVSYVLASLHCAFWLIYAFSRPEDVAVDSIPAWVRSLVIGMLVVSAVFAITNWHMLPAVVTVSVPWAHLRYHFVVTTTAGDIYGVLVPSLLAIVFVRFLVRYLAGERNLRWQLFGFAIFFVCAVVEALVAYRVIVFVSLADFGLLAVVLPISMSVIERLTADAERLRELSGDLAGQVLRRTEERDRAETALVEAERLAALGRLAAGVGHEINNPLTYMQLALEDVQDYVGESPAPQSVKDAVGFAQEGARRIQRAVEGLRSYSRRQDERVPVDLREVASAALRVAQPHLRHVARVETVATDAPRVLGDEARLVQAVVNVLVNAGRAVASIPGGGHIVIRTGRIAPGAATLAVTDDGPGIVPEHLPKLTEPYFTTHAHGGSLGLGLFVTRGIVDTHGGRFEVESELGFGTTVTITLPAMPPAAVVPSGAERSRTAPPDALASAPPAAAPAPAPLEAAPAAAARTSPRTDDDLDDVEEEEPAPAPGVRRALIVDDEPLVGKFFRSGLKATWAVTCAVAADEALALLDTETFDAIACDLMMPGMSGMEFAAELERRHPALRMRTMFLTGGAVTPAAEQFLDRPDVVYMTKPVRLRDLDARLRELADRADATTPSGTPPR
jgi:signal transduction histidine kinase/ActR/RegA family two-component response regulator